MSDFFHEVDEEVRREKLKQLWDRYQVLIVGAAVLIIVLIGGWRLYEWYEARQAAEAGAAFNAAMTLAAEGKHEEAHTAFAKVAEQGTAGYRDLARLQAAAELAHSDAKAAIERYDAIAADARLPQTLRDLAAVRAGLLLVDTAPYDEMRGRLEALAGNDRAFRNTARELLALSALRAGNQTAARQWADMIAIDPGAPPQLRQRVQMLMALAGDPGRS